MNAGFRLTLVLLGSATFFAQGRSDLARSLESHGGAAVRNAITIDARGTATRTSGEAPIRIRATLDRIEANLRIDYGSPTTLSVITTPDGQVELRGNQTILKEPHSGLFSQLDLFGGLSLPHLTLPGVASESVGVRDVRGRSSQRVWIQTGRERIRYGRTLKDEADIYIDEETGLVSAISRTGYASEALDRSFVLTNEFSDYRDVSGVLIPFRIDRYLDRMAVETILIEEVVLNTVLPADSFERSQQ
jgi:hypothetical protein